MFFAIKQIGLCKAWARIFLIIICILNTSLYGYMFKIKAVNITEWALFIFQAMLQVVALIFLYDKESNIWVNSRKSEKLS